MLLLLLSCSRCRLLSRCQVCVIACRCCWPGDQANRQQDDRQRCILLFFSHILLLRLPAAIFSLFLSSRSFGRTQSLPPHPLPFSLCLHVVPETMSYTKSHREWNPDCKVYIGNLSEGASKNDVEHAFGKYGPLRNVWVARNPPGFAFVEYDDHRDAEDAVRGLDGTKIAGARVRVEMSHGRSRRGGFHGERGGLSRGGPPPPSSSRARYGSPPPHHDYR